MRSLKIPPPPMFFLLFCPFSFIIFYYCLFWTSDFTNVKLCPVIERILILFSLEIWNHWKRRKLLRNAWRNSCQARISISYNKCLWDRSRGSQGVNRDVHGFPHGSNVLWFTLTERVNHIENTEFTILKEFTALPGWVISFTFVPFPTLNVPLV